MLNFEKRSKFRKPTWKKWKGWKCLFKIAQGRYQPILSPASLLAVIIHLKNILVALKINNLGHFTPLNVPRMLISILRAFIFYNTSMPGVRTLSHSPHTCEGRDVHIYKCIYICMYILSGRRIVASVSGKTLGGLYAASPPPLVIREACNSSHKPDLLRPQCTNLESIAGLYYWRFWPLALGF
jgi:hypothetical protein